MSKTWGKIGAWAAEAERAEEEEKEQAAALAAAAPPQSYPSLKEAVTTTKGGFSRADEIDNWAMNKKPVAPPPPARSSTFGSGFRDSGGPEPDRWSRGAGIVTQERATERRRLVLDPPKGDSASAEPVVKTDKPNPFGDARPREDVLAEKGLDWKKADLELEAKKNNSRPTSSHSNSRPGSAQSGRSAEGTEKPRPKVNPFGDAKPREVLLQEKGVDYRKIDLELERRRFARSETEAEKYLKEEIDNLKKEFEKESNENQTSLHNTILEKERMLEQLSLDLDNKLRVSQKAVERPGSGAGRVGPGFQERPGSGAGRVGPGYQERPGSGAGRVGPGYQERPGSGAGRVGMGYQERPGSGAGRMGSGFLERPPSQSGSFDDSRSVDFSERPRSRGNPWMRPDDERRGFGGGRDGGFLGNRDFGRRRMKEMKKALRYVLTFKKICRNPIPVVAACACVKLPCFATFSIYMVVKGARISNIYNHQSSSCQFPAIYNFGDSNSDTGAVSAAFGPLVAPHGMTYFHKPSGRYSDGRLIIDFFAEKLGFPYLSAYLDSIGTNFRHGANFAASGCTIQPADALTLNNTFDPLTLDVQLSQFEQFKQRSLDVYNEVTSSEIKDRLPRYEDYSRALYTFDIGQNDIHAGIIYMKEDQAKTYIPTMISEFASVVEKLYQGGARTFGFMEYWSNRVHTFLCQKLPTISRQPKTNRGVVKHTHGHSTRI
ncbi:GDSL esterase/lipase [Artemisia annua]|uniref:GDSL esterase/lipase n=1 Tax=Artemisia annua TaxID=35608 RepID=A0A2U1KCC9_ARTAN|nr:GDSL esterase/lipase [Artemisia annua]